MRYVIYQDEHGFKRRAMVRDGDGDETARSGIPAGPPDISRFIDCQTLLRQINNRMVDEGIFTLEELQKSPTGVSMMSNMFKKVVVGAMKEEIRNEKDDRKKAMKS